MKSSLLNRQQSLDAYFAGFIDADGTFGIDSTCAYVSVSQVHPEVLEALAERYGGFVQGPFDFYEGRRPIYRWTAKTRACRKALDAILPHLIVKRERAQLLLDYMAIGRLPRKGYREEERARVLQERKRIKGALTDLNRRGTILD